MSELRQGTYPAMMQDFKGKKIGVFKTKRRKGYKKTQGHRTLQTRVRVQSINL